VSKPVAVGVVGVGALGSHHARILSGLEGASLIGVYDRAAAVGRAVAERLQTRAFPSREELLEAVEAVTIAVPTPAHHDVGLAALRAGRHVLMEKPLAATLEAADELVEAARSRDLVLQVGHVERFNRALRAARPYLDQPRFIESHRLAPFQPRGSDVAVILDLMIHDLDLVLDLVGQPPIEVRAAGVPVVTPHIDIANARLEFSSGAVANITASRVSLQRVRKLRLFQTTGYLSLDLAQGSGEFVRLREGWQGAGSVTSLDDVVEVLPLDAPEAEPLALELASFLAEVRGESGGGVSGAAGRAALALALEVADVVGRSRVAATRW
jgi:predicted dehydrogenase